MGGAKEEERQSVHRPHPMTCTFSKLPGQPYKRANPRAVARGSIQWSLEALFCNSRSGLLATVTGGSLFQPSFETLLQWSFAALSTVLYTCFSTVVWALLTFVKALLQRSFSALLQRSFTSVFQRLWRFFSMVICTFELNQHRFICSTLSTVICGHPEARHQRAPDTVP